MKIIALAAGLGAALIAGNAVGADWACQGEASGWPGEMAVTLTVSDHGKLKHGDASLRLGGKAMQLPMAMVTYDFERLGEPALGKVTFVTVGAGVDAENPPKSKTASIELIIGDKRWSRAWGMYAQRPWEGRDAAGFFGAIPMPANEAMGKAIDTADFLLIRVVGDEGGEVIAMRQQALSSRKAIQPLVDEAHAKALAATKDFRNACEVVGERE
ncbi:MAG TPA: hypothetical protein VEA44_01040 [Caulobacter sp.]|nr:hypothetical protein [Caulobacter sp.]